MNMNDAFLGSLIFNKNGGGSGGEFSITLTKEDDRLSIDKTFAEILAAYNEGKTIVLCPSFNNFEGKIICNSITTAGDDVYGFGFVGVLWGGSDDIYQISCFIDDYGTPSAGYEKIYYLYPDS